MSIKHLAFLEKTVIIDFKRWISSWFDFRKEEETVLEFIEQQTILFERYRILRPLGQGGQARAYLVEHIGMKREYALKCVPKPFGSDLEGCLESQILKILKHPKIPILYDIQEDEKYYYLFEEFIHGVPLSSHVTNHTISKDTIIWYIIQLCEILEYLHARSEPIIFGDIQPQNILIDEEEVYLVDFGNACKKGMVHEGYCYGTLGFAAPEQYEGRILDEKTDIYGVGALLYYCITKKAPGGTWHVCDPALDPIIHICMRHEPSMRYQSILELKRALRHLKPGENSGKNPSLCVSIAGTRPGIGVTHMALALTAAAERMGKSAVYEERNASHAVADIAKENQLRLHHCFYEWGKISLIPQLKENVAEEPVTCDVRFLDFGTLTQENIQEFRRADIRIVMIGIRNWETSLTRRSLSMLRGEEIHIFVNFTDAKTFWNYQRMAPLAVRVPYFTDWEKPRGAGEEFLMEFLSGIGVNSLYKNKRKIRRFWRRKNVLF